MESCYKCDHSGQLLAKHKENNCIYMFLCDMCNIANIRGLAKSISKWSSFLESFYILEKPSKRDLNYINKGTSLESLKPIPIPKIDHSLKAANDHTLDDEIPF